MPLVHQQVFLTPGASFVLKSAKIILGPLADQTDAAVSFQYSADMQGYRDEVHGGPLVGTIELMIMGTIPKEFNVYLDEPSGKFYYVHPVITSG
jgi:hypothetical protein